MKLKKKSSFRRLEIIITNILLLTASITLVVIKSFSFSAKWHLPSLISSQTSQNGFGEKFTSYDLYAYTIDYLWQHSNLLHFISIIVNLTHLKNYFCPLLSNQHPKEMASNMVWSNWHLLFIMTNNKM